MKLPLLNLTWKRYDLPSSSVKTKGSMFLADASTGLTSFWVYGPVSFGASATATCSLAV